MQIMTAIVDGEVHSFSLPPPNEPLSHGGRWGSFDSLCVSAWNFDPLTGVIGM
jgi:hypothetical protein